MSDTATTTNNLEVKVTSSEKDGVISFEGSVTLPGLARTKLARADGTTKFTTVSTLKGAARRLAQKYGYEGVEYAETQVRKAAKRSAPASATCASTDTTPTT